MPNKTKITPTSTHWGNYKIETTDGQISGVKPLGDDPDPSPIAQSMIDSLDPRVRVSQPMVRKSYLEKGIKSDRTQRGLEPFVAVSWDRALNLVADELKRVIAGIGYCPVIALHLVLRLLLGCLPFCWKYKHIQGRPQGFTTRHCLCKQCVSNQREWCGK